MSSTIWSLREKFLQRTTPKSRAQIGTAFTAGLLLILWYLAGEWYRVERLLDQRGIVLEEVALRETALSLAINSRVTLLRGLYAFVQAEPSDSQFGDKFATFAAELYAGSHDVDYLALAPEGIIQYIYPPDAADIYLNRDLLHDPRPNVHADIDRALRLRMITVTSPYVLLDGSTGIVARLAVYREDTFWGLVSVAIDMDSLLDEAGLGAPSDSLAYALRSGDGDVFFGSAEIFEQAPVLRRVELPDNSWELAGIPHEGWNASLEPSMLIFRTGSLVIVILLSGITYSSINRQGQLSEAVDLRTREIAGMNQILEQRVQKRTQELATLLEVARNVASTLELRPLLELILDQLKTVVDFTAAAIFELEGADSLILIGYRGPLTSADLPIRWELGDSTPYSEVVKTHNPIIVSADHTPTEWHRILMGRTSATLPLVATWMGVPLMVKDQVVGMLALEHTKSDTYTSQESELAFAFAHQAAVAIDNARLYGEAKQVAALKERQKLARELHDSVSQAVYGIALSARTAQTLIARNPAKAVEPLEYVLTLAEAALTEMRALIFELRPESLENEGLVAALHQQAELLRVRHDLEVLTDFPEQEPLLDLNTKQMLYRIAQEALHNTVKHARANRAEIRLLVRDDSLELQVVDDGQGFDTAGLYPGHFGLVTMRERAERIKGIFHIESSIGHGTHLCVSIPLK